MFLARVFVTLKPAVNDPQGETVLNALRQLGFDEIESVRAGKYLEIRLDGERESEAARRIEEMCDRLLANPVIENYRFELEHLEGRPRVE